MRVAPYSKGVDVGFRGQEMTGPEGSLGREKRTHTHTWEGDERTEKGQLGRT